MRHPGTLEQLKSYSYGTVEMRAYNPKSCGYDIWSQNGLPIEPYQCTHKCERGSLYCRKHLEMFEDERLYLVQGE